MRMHGMHWEARFRRLAEQQEGVVGRDQLSEIDCDWNHWARAKRNGRWTVRSDRVLTAKGTSVTDGQRVHGALLDAGGSAVLHGPSTLAWCGMRDFDLSMLHVTRRRGTRTAPCSLAVVHRLRDLEPDEVCLIRGIPSVTPLRAIWSEASRYSNQRWHERGLRRVGRLLDDANGMGLVRWADLQASVDALAERGRSGTRIMRELAAERPPGSSVNESRNEDRFEEIVVGEAVPAMARQVILGRGRPLGRADFAGIEVPLAVEVNSNRFHASLSDQRHDEIRYEKFVADGNGVAVIWEDDLWGSPPNVVRTVQEATWRLRTGRPAVVHSASCPWPSDPRRIVIARSLPDRRG